MFSSSRFPLHNRIRRRIFPSILGKLSIAWEVTEYDYNAFSLSRSVHFVISMSQDAQRRKREVASEKFCQKSRKCELFEEICKYLIDKQAKISVFDNLQVNYSQIELKRTIFRELLSVESKHQWNFFGLLSLSSPRELSENSLSVVFFVSLAVFSAI